MMPRHPRTLIALSLLLGLAGCATNVVAQPGTTVTIAATSSKPVYAQGEPIKVVLYLKNATGADVFLSDVTAGTLIVDSLTRDGVAVQRRDSIVKYDEDLGSQLSQGAKKVRPGDSLSITWQSEEDLPQKGETLDTVVYEPRKPNAATHYLVSLPGQYELTLRYQFPRGADTSGTVFAGQLGPTTVSFTVSP